MNEIMSDEVNIEKSGKHKCERCYKEYEIGITGEWCPHGNLQEIADGDDDFRSHVSADDRLRVKALMSPERRTYMNRMKRQRYKALLWKYPHYDMLAEVFRGITNRAARAQAVDVFVKYMLDGRDSYAFGFDADDFVHRVMSENGKAENGDEMENEGGAC
jgi:hypothetical protein